MCSTNECDLPNIHYQLAGSPINLLQAYFAQLSGASTPALQVPLPAILQSQVHHPQVNLSKKPSKGIKGYPDGWQKVLNGAKDIVRGSVLIKDPFPTPNLARITVNEAFHEVLASECSNNGLVLEPGTSFRRNHGPLSNDSMSKQGSHGPNRWFKSYVIRLF